MVSGLLKDGVYVWNFCGCNAEIERPADPIRSPLQDFAAGSFQRQHQMNIPYLHPPKLDAHQNGIDSRKMVRYSMC